MNRIIRNRSNPLFWMPIIFLIKFIDIKFINKNNSPTWQERFQYFLTNKLYGKLKKYIKNLEIILEVAEEGLEPPTRGL